MKKICALFAVLVLCLWTATAAAQDFVAVENGYYQNNRELVYPVIKATDPAASEKMNRAIRKEMAQFVIGMQQEFPGAKVGLTLGTVYEVPCNKQGLLSVILTEYSYLKGAAHPLIAKHTLNFDSATGALLNLENLSDILGKDKGSAGISPADLTRKLRAKAEREGIMLFDGLQILSKCPPNFYFDDDLHLHFIFQLYDVAPYAAGIIDLDADAEK